MHFKRSDAGSRSPEVMGLQRLSLSSQRIIADDKNMPHSNCRPNQAEIDVTLRRLEPITDRRPRMPVAFVPHGGGPWPFVEMGLPSDEVAELKQYLRSVRALPGTPPSALLVVSAHW